MKKVVEEKQVVPMVDLKIQFQNIKNEILEIVTEILEGSQYILGPRVSELERKIADYIGMSEAVGVASCTDALHLSLDSLGIGHGDEVITSPFTFFATVEAILYTGAKPVFVDIEPDTFNIDINQIEGKITEKTKAILPVHLYGHTADMKEILNIARGRGLRIIEDCAQSFGAKLNGRKAGSFGDAGCFSFYPSKNLGGYGDGGIVVLSNSQITGTIKKLRNHGSKASYIHEKVGLNSRLDEIQAGILLVKLKYIDEYNRLRRQKAALYTELLPDKVKCPVEKKGAYHVYHQYTIRSPRRDEIQKRLMGKGISSVVYYPVPLHLQEAVRFLGYKIGDFPVAEKACQEVLSLPVYPEMKESVIEEVAKIIRNVV